MSYPSWIDDVDYEAPTSCGHCDERIRESDMNAGYYATRDNHETTLHVSCAEEFDAENPGRMLEDDKPGEQWPDERSGAKGGVGVEARSQSQTVPAVPEVSATPAPSSSRSGMLQDRKAEWYGWAF